MLVEKSCVELLGSCGINNLVAVSENPAFCLNYKLPTTKHSNLQHTEVFILAFLLGCVLLPRQQGWLKTRFKNRVPKCDVTKNKFAKLWDLVPFSNRASLEKGPCQKLPLNCNFQPKYKG